MLKVIGVIVVAYILGTVFVYGVEEFGVMLVGLFLAVAALGEYLQ